MGRWVAGAGTETSAAPAKPRHRVSPMPSELTHCRECRKPIPEGQITCPSCSTPILGQLAAGSTRPGTAGQATGIPELLPAAFLPGTVVDEKYEVRDRLGAGGFGEVYRVHHRILRRDLALKTLHPALIDNSQVRERFFREAQVLMDLSHPNIVTMRDVGEWRGHLFLVMDFCAGETLARMLARQKRLSARVAVSIALPVLRALEYAHERGVVHRDLKPANFVLAPKGAPDGLPDVKVLDFGIAKVLHEERTGDASALTSAGVAIGTVAYMSPEQATGAQVDARADLYSLGVVLYEMVAGHVPFESPDMTQMFKMILMDSPPPLTRLNVHPDLPGFERLVQRALAKSPDGRPGSASEMARDLEALLRAPTPRPRYGAALAAGALLCTIAGGAIAWLTSDPGPANGDPPGNDPRVDRPGNHPPNPAGNTPVAPAKVPPADPVAIPQLGNGLVHPQGVVDVVYHPDGTCLASGCQDGSVRVWDLATGSARTAAKGHTGEVTSIDWSSDGSLIASAGRDRKVRLWSADGQELHTFPPLEAEVLCVSFHPDGKTLAASADDGHIVLWDVPDRKLIEVLEGYHLRAVPAIAFSPDGMVFASAGIDGNIRIWNSGTRRPIGMILGVRRPVVHLTWFDSGRSLGSSGFDGFVRIWKLPQREQERAIYHGVVQCTGHAVRRDGKLLASAGKDQKIRLWDRESGSCLAVLDGAKAQVLDMEFSPDGTRLAAAGLDREVRFWDVSGR